MPSATDLPADHQPYVFVSYASADRERVLPIVDALERAGVSVWIDREGIHGGASYAAEIDDAIERCAAFVLMTSAASLGSRNVKQEIALAWEYERPYLPLLLEAVAIPKDVKYWLTAAQWIEVLDKAEGQWLPQVLTALALLGITPKPAEQEEIQLVGREREQTLLRKKLGAAKGGKGSLVLIGGEAGIGKTTLAEAILREAEQQGLLVLTGRCYDLTETPPYGPWSEVRTQCLRTPGLPEPPAIATTQSTNQAAFFAEVRDFFTLLTAARPLILLLDDLHWADPASLDLLRFISRSLTDWPVLLLVTYRSDEITRRHPLAPLLPLLVREVDAARLDLHALDAPAVRTLVDAQYALPDAEGDRLAAYLTARSEGNALFVNELLHALEETRALRQDEEGWTLGALDTTAVPPLLRQVIESRIGRLADESQRLLGVAAVIGQEIGLNVWATVGEVEEEALLNVAEEAEEARILAAGSAGARVRFAHALIREALYEGIPSIRRRRIHRRVGEALIANGHPDPDAVAYHFQRAGDARAYDWLLRAGGRAQAAYAFLTAADRFAAAALMNDAEVAVGDRGWLLVRLGLLVRYLDPQRGVRHLEEAARQAASADDPVLAATAECYLGHVRAYYGDLARGIAEMARGVAALAALAPEGRVRYAEQVSAGTTVNEDTPQATLSAWLSIVGRYAEARALAERVVATQPVADAYQSLVRVHAALGQAEQARQAARMSRDLYRVGEHHALVGFTDLWDLHWVVLPYYADNLAERHSLATSAEQAWVQAIGALPSDDFSPRSARLCLMALEGAWDAIPQLIPATVAKSMFTFDIWFEVAKVARGQGNIPLVWSIVQAALPEGASTAPGDAYFLPALELQRVAAAVSLDMGDRTLVKEWLKAHDRWLAWSGAVLGQSEGQALWAQYYRQAGDDQQAYEHAERALAHATEPRQPLALLAAHRLLGELDTEAGRNEGAAAHLDASLALADACQAPYERALTLLAMAALRAAQGASDDAKRLLDAVKAICAPLGAKPALARADVVAARLTSG